MSESVRALLKHRVAWHIMAYNIGLHPSFTSRSWISNASLVNEVVCSRERASFSSSSLCKLELLFFSSWWIPLVQFSAKITLAARQVLAIVAKCPMLSFPSSEISVVRANNHQSIKINMLLWTILRLEINKWTNCTFSRLWNWTWSSPSGSRILFSSYFQGSPAPTRLGLKCRCCFQESLFGSKIQNTSFLLFKESNSVKDDW